MRFDFLDMQAKNLFLGKALVFLLSTAILFMDFSLNYWGVADQDWFDVFQSDSEALVVGRVAESRAHGSFSKYAVLGFDQRGVQSAQEQERLLNSDSATSQYKAYLSQSGIQGLLLSVVDALDGGYRKTLNRLRLFVALCSAVVLSVLVVWLYHEFGVITALGAVATLALSQWLVVIGRNLYWFVVLYFLPCVAFLYCGEKFIIQKKWTCLAVVALSLVFLKCLAGYEYISVVLLSMFVPFTYSVCLGRIASADFRKASISVLIGGVLGFFCAVFVQIAQISAYLGGVSHGWTHFLERAKTRTMGIPQDLPYGGFGLADIILRYLNETVLVLPKAIFVEGWRLSLGEIVWVLVTLSVVPMLCGKQFPTVEQARRKIIALRNVVWLCLVASFSWVVLAKEHAYIHGHVNPFTFAFPFGVLWGAFVALTLSVLIHDLFLKIKVSVWWEKLTYAGMVFSAASLVSAHLIDARVPEFVKVAVGSGAAAYSSDGVRVYFGMTSETQNKIIYVVEGCSEGVLNKRFFLHFYPNTDADLSGLNDKGFQNADFSHSSFKKYRYVGNSYCVATATVPTFSVEKIVTGQFDNSGRIWEWSYSKKSLLLENLNDSNWSHGVNVHENVLLLKIGRVLSKDVENAKIIFSDFWGERNVSHVSKVGGFWHLHYNGPHVVASERRVEISIRE